MENAHGIATDSDEESDDSSFHSLLNLREDPSQDGDRFVDEIGDNGNRLQVIEYEMATDSEEDSDDSFVRSLLNLEGDPHLDVENGGHIQAFSSDIVPEHSYLGRDMETVHGRTFFDEGSIVSLPILIQPGFVGVPGQTFPLTTDHPRTVAMLRNALDGNRTFGILSIRLENSHLEKIGSSAEIYEFGESDIDSSLRIKAKVRQRFKVIESRQQVDGRNIMGTVEILPENVLSDALHLACPATFNRYRVPPGVGGSLFTCRPLIQKRMHRKLLKLPCTVWPSWVYGNYDLDLLSERVRNELRKSLFVDGSSSGSPLPRDPIELSYWVIKNLTLEDKQRIQLLSINNANQRLRAELSILEQCEYLCCRECSYVCASQSDVFAMSKDGPQGAYVNPFGVVHETLTVHKVDGIKVRSAPSTEFSWFPGYAWSIGECKYCMNHMGWLFTATNRQLQPQRFWGLCRTSLKPKLKTDQPEGGFRLVF